MFLCALYVPACNETTGETKLPCKSLCEHSKFGCQRLMEGYGFSWPERLSCEHFPGTDCLNFEGRVVEVDDEILQGFGPHEGSSGTVLLSSRKQNWF